MKRSASAIGASLLLLVSCQPVIPFKLDLSSATHTGEMRRTVLKLIVTLTNTSKGWISEDPCSSGGGLYELSVLYDGFAVPEPEEVRLRREAKEDGEAKGGICSGHGGRRIKPGEHWEDVLYYDAAKPGRYEFTVERREFSRGPEKSTTIKSNTLTITTP